MLAVGNVYCVIGLNMCHSVHTLTISVCQASRGVQRWVRMAQQGKGLNQHG